uniref:NADH dehydrogenase subunit 4L n=1 Tax=Dictyotopsis propagulifera TaxID=670095 RepID=UPI002E789417|nr:NADH dehydrogenase subunit 4L [Dictyotopsis propagulifera]WBP69947.1 NADH dehydrogenase subunit 4L [Dictyotopsis propagulifera]
MPIILLFYITSFTFFIGVCGVVLNRTNILAVLMSLEIALFSVSLNFLIASVYLDDTIGQIFALFVLTVAACESSIGLAIILIYYRVRGSVRIDQACLLKS